MRSRFPTLTVIIWIASVVLVGCTARPSRPAAHYDLILRGGMVVDGTGAPARRADVAVAGDRIAAIAPDLEGSAGTVVDVAGRVVAPGFVDLHSHADLIVLGDLDTQRRLLGAKMAQGVTTLVIGNCGLGVAPASDEAAALLADVNGWMTPEGVRTGAMSVGRYLDRLEATGVVVNVGTLIPHGPVRISAMGLARGEPDADALDAMLAAVARGLDDGALGVSVGLIYPPGMYASTDELVAVAEVVASRDRLFTAHVRGSSELLIPATRELVDIARRSGARVHHSHLEAVGEPFWPAVDRVLEIEDDARAEGLGLSHDVFPYTRAATMMSAIFPPWSLEGGVPALLRRLQDPVARAAIGDEIESRVPSWPPWVEGGWPHNLVGAVGWDGILVASVGSDDAAGLVGRDLAASAEARSVAPFDLVADLMVSEGGRVGQQVAEISGSDDDLGPLLSILEHPAAAIVSDAEDYGRGSPHPAHAGAFARALRLSREQRGPSLEDTVRRMTSYPASVVGLRERGVVRVGAVADLVVFDPDEVSDRSTWDDPRARAVGVERVLVGGRQVVSDGRILDAGAAGRVLRAADRSDP